MPPTLEIPQLSLAERDRRYAAVRKPTAARDRDETLSKAINEALKPMSLRTD